MPGVRASIGGAVTIAAASTLGDFIWATWIPRHLPLYGLIHGTLLFLSVGLFLGALHKRPGVGALSGAVIGGLAAASFYLLAPVAGYSVMFLVWIGRLGRDRRFERAPQALEGRSPRGPRTGCDRRSGRVRGSLLPDLRNLVSLRSQRLVLPDPFCRLDTGIHARVRGATHLENSVMTPLFTHGASGCSNIVISPFYCLRFAWYPSWMLHRLPGTTGRSGGGRNATGCRGNLDFSRSGRLRDRSANGRCRTSGPATGRSQYRETAFMSR